MKLKRIMSLLLCIILIVTSNLHGLSAVQAAETISEAEDEGQYEVETEESYEDTQTQETEEIVENDMAVETYLEEESDGVRDEEENNEIYIEEEESSYGRSATGSVAINETNFPDEGFREYIKRSFDKDRDNVLSESERGAVTGIDVDYKNISSLKGIEYFTVLEYLSCYNNALTSLDVSKNTTLTTLVCDGNALSSLDISKNLELQYLFCSSNKLTSLNISEATALEGLLCSSNYLTNLDISRNIALKWIICSENSLASLDVSKNAALEELHCSDNKLTSLTGLGNLTKLYSFDVSNNLLTVLPDMTGLTDLEAYDYEIRDHFGVTSLKNNYLSESEIRKKLPTQLLENTTWLQTQIDSQYKIAKPTALTLSIPSASSIKLSWTKASDVSGYEVWYATSKAGTYQKAKTTTASGYTQTGLKAGTTYYYKIRSYKTVSGVKVYGAYTSVTSKKLTVPTPKNVKVTNSSATSLKISWSKVADASGYEIYCATSKTGTYSKIKTITSGTTVSYTNKSLKNNKTYYYKVHAYRTVNGVKKYSSYCSILSKKVSLAKTTLTAATKSKTSIKLSWTKVSGATKYEIYRSTSKNGTYKKIKTVTTVSYTNTKLTSNKTYYYKVKAVQGSYKSAYSEVQSTKTTK